MTFRLQIGAQVLSALLTGLIWVHPHAAASDYSPVDHDDSYVYRLPYADGVSYVVTQAWGGSFSHMGREHYAVDFAMPEGTPVHAARDGVVLAIEESNDSGCATAQCQGLANFVAIRHDDGTIGEYFHLQRDGVHVEVGERVMRGQQIGSSGNTGFSNVPHLHFGVYMTTSNGDQRSIDIRFLTSSGIVSRPRSGGRYRTENARLSVSVR